MPSQGICANLCSIIYKALHEQAIKLILKQMSQRIKTLLDRIGTLVPGFDGYAKRDDQRRSDKLLRSQIAQTLQKVQVQFEQLMKVTLKKGVANELLEMEEIRKACSTIEDKINYSTYGASSLFDAEQIKEDELCEIYKIDELLLDRSNHLCLIVQQDQETSFMMAATRNHLMEIDQLFTKRSNYIRFNGKR